MGRIDRLNGIIASLAIKAPCVAKTQANITLEGEQTIDGVSVTAGDRVLVASQTTGSENGIYDASEDEWSRAPDFDGNRDATAGTLVYITGGTASGDMLFQLDTESPVIGTTALTFSAASITPANVTITGGTIDGTTIGATTASTGRFSQLTVEDDVPWLRMTDSNNTPNNKNAQLDFENGFNIYFQNSDRSANGILMQATRSDTTATGLTIWCDTSLNAGYDFRVTDTGMYWAGTDDDLRLYHTGSNGAIDNATGTFFIQELVDAGSISMSVRDSGSVSRTCMILGGGATPYARLYHGGTEKLRTNSAGVSVAVANGASDALLRIAESRTADGNAYLELFSDTSGAFMSRFFRGSGANANTFIEHKGTGVLFIQANNNGTIRNRINGTDIFYTVSTGIEMQPSMTLQMDLTTEDEGFINFKSTIDADATSAISSNTTSGAVTHHIQVKLNGTTAWIPCSTTDPT